MLRFFKKVTRLLFILVILSSSSFASETLLIFAGAASKPVLEEVTENFENENGVKININFGGSGALLSQMKLTRKGDIYIPGSHDFMEKAKMEKLVLPETEEKIADLVPSICVSPDNPKKINSLEDLANKGVRIGIGEPQTVCVGLYAVEIIEGSGLKEKIMPNIVAYAESCEKTAYLIVMKNVDAIFGWSVFENWAPDKIKSIPIEPKYLKRTAYIPAALSVYCKSKELALRYIQYLKSPECRKIFKENGY